DSLRNSNTPAYPQVSWCTASQAYAPRGLAVQKREVVPLRLSQTAFPGSPALQGREFLSFASLPPFGLSTPAWALYRASSLSTSQLRITGFLSPLQGLILRDFWHH